MQRADAGGPHLQLLDLLAAERAVRQHATDAAANGLCRIALHEVLVGLALDATGVPRVPVHALVGGLVLGEHHLGGIDDDHVVATVDVRGERGLVLAAEQPSCLGAQTAEHQIFGVDHVPCTRDLAGLRAVGSHHAVSFINTVLHTSTPSITARTTEDGAVAAAREP